MSLKSTSGSLTAWSNMKSSAYTFATVQNQDAQSELRFEQFDLGQKDTSTQILGVAQCQDRLSSLSWDNFSPENYSMGLLAGGTENGSVYFWDVNSVVNRQDGLLAVIDNLYEGPVSTMEFNSFKPNLIAMGGNDVLIMDIVKDMANPSIYSPGEPNLHEENAITSVSWNKKVPHILASASQNGLIVVWDLKINKSIFNFQDSSAVCNRHVNLSWNPEIPTQIAVTYDDERVPELQIWDLRNPQGPVIVFNQAHKLGINCLSWCPMDHSLLLTAGRDNQVICWNYKTQSIVSQEQLDFHIADLHWSNKVSSVYSVSSTESETFIRSMGGAKQGYAPKWYKPPIGASFSFDNLATFKESSTSIQLYHEEHTEHHVFQDLNRYMDAVTIQDRIATMRSNELLQLISAVSKGAVNDLLQTLGFSANEITQQTENYTGKRHAKKNDVKKVERQRIDFTTISESDANNFFDQLTTQSIKQQSAAPKVTNNKEIYAYDQVSKNTNWDVGVERIIKNNLIIGNYEGAIDCALKSGRSAEALLLAYSQGKEMFESTMNTFLTSQTDVFLKHVVKHIVLKQPEEIAKNYELTNWKECAAIVKDSNQYSQIMETLGERFVAAKDEHNALACFILAKNGTKAMEILIKAPRSLEQLAETIKLLLLIEEIALDETDYFSEQLDTLILQFAYRAIGMGQYLSAAHVLQYASPTNNKALVLFDLLYNGNHSSRDKIRSLYHKPNFPFKQAQTQLKVQVQKPVQQTKQPVQNPNVKNAPPKPHTNQVNQQNPFNNEIAESSGAPPPAPIKKAQIPPPKPVKSTDPPPVRPTQQPILQSIPQPVQQPIQQQINQPNPIQQPVQQGPFGQNSVTSNPFQQPVTQPIQQPVQQPVQPPVQTQRRPGPPPPNRAGPPPPPKRA